ncbi:MAG: lysylphosphatidylglycerol synthase transmembrane domain-containing protein [Chitinophagales bacterium]
MNARCSSILIKLLLFGLVLWLIYHFQLRKINQAQIQIRFSLIALAFVLFHLKNILLGLRLYYCARLQGYKLRLRSAIIMAYRTWFLMLFLPIPGSEDLFRFLFLRKHEIPAAVAVNGLLLDRIGATLGLGAALALGFFLLLLGGVTNYYHPLYAYLFFFFLLLLTLPFYKSILRFLARVFRRPLQKLIPSFDVVLEEVTSARSNGRILLVSSVSSFLGGLLTVFILLALSGLGFDFYNAGQFLVGIPFFYLSASLPISYEGLGLMETSFFLYLKFMNLNTEAALQVPLLHFFFQLTLLMVGGVVFVSGQDYIPSAKLIKDSDGVRKSTGGRGPN